MHFEVSQEHFEGDIAFSASLQPPAAALRGFSGVKEEARKTGLPSPEAKGEKVSSPFFSRSPPRRILTSARRRRKWKFSIDVPINAGWTVLPRCRE